MKRVFRLLAVIAALCLLAGCGLSYEDLYSLPRASEDYYDLQEALSAVIAQGNSYLAPASGARQEPVQLTDLDGDGVDEAVAFFQSTADGAVRVYVFSQDGGVYTPSAVIEGAGTAVAAVEYADLTGSGDLEILITYQVSESVTQALQVYHYTGDQAATMLTAGCSQFELMDLDGDDLPELICLTGAGADSATALECYDGRDGELVRVGEQRLQASYGNLRRIQRGVLEPGKYGLMISGVSAEGRLLTDVFVLGQKGLKAVTPQEDILTAAPIHSYYVYPEDLDGDGVTEIPSTRKLPAFDSGSTAQWVVDWYTLRPDGSCQRQFTTYQNFGDNWYLRLLEAWNEDLTIKALDESPTLSTVTLYQTRGGSPQEILTIYTLRGTERQDYAAQHSLTTLFSDSELTVAVTLAAAEVWEGTTTLSEVAELFHYTRSAGQTAAGDGT